MTTPHPRIALVTGGSRGLGRAMVERLARDGLRVLFSYRSNQEAAASVEQAVADAGGEAHGLQADGSSLAGVEALFAQVDERLVAWGEGTRLHAVIANAGVMSHQQLDAVTEEEFDRVFDLNVKGALFTIQRAVARMADGGRVITLGSGLTRVAKPDYLVYSASKSAIDHMTRVLAQTLGPRGITANVLAPGAIDTDMNAWLKTEEGVATATQWNALGRVGHAEDIADVASFLVSDDSRWVTAQRVEASGGQLL